MFLHRQWKEPIMKYYLDSELFILHWVIIPEDIDIIIICSYNVITMITKLIEIGNSRGVRIPKPLLNESGLGNEVELQVEKGEIRIVTAPRKSISEANPLLLSEKVLGVDWNRPEEDEAWASLQ